MKKGFKKGLSVLVGVLMLISMIPIGVMAEEATAVNGAAVNQSDENVDSQGGSDITPMPNSLTMPSANDPMVNGRNNIPGEPVTAASGIDPAPQAVPQNLETTEAIQASAAEGDFEYEAVAGGVSITRYTGPGGNVVIPGTLGGKKVVAIGEFAFSGCSSLTTITIPDSVTRIGPSAFWACSSLTSITIPDSVTTIGGWAFSGCSSLTNVNIPNSVTNIEYETFYGCSSLTNITIPDGVTSIDNSAFSGCSSLTSINVNSNNLNYSSLDGVLFDKAVTTLILCPRGKASITIPNSVTTIGDNAFSGCSSLTNVTIPDSVTGIGHDAFSGCSSLTNITIPDGVTNIGYCAFQDCSSLTNITIPDSVTSIAKMTFVNCSSLTDVTIPDNVTSIGNWAFSGCSSLTNVTLPDSVTSIGFFAFEDCSSLTNIIIPDRVTSIGGAAFWGCSSLTSIQINSADTTIIDTGGDGAKLGNTIPVSTTIIGHNPSTAKDFALKYNRTFIEIGADKTLKEIVITSPAQKLVYKVGETLDLTGLVVTGTYSDGTSKVETLTSDNVTGFNSSATVANQVLTITIGGKTATYTVKIVAGEEPEKGELTGFLGQDPAGNYYLYNKADFNNSYLAYQINPNLSGAKMYRHYMNQPCRIVALKDLTRGYMDYSATASASLSAQLRGETFDIDAYFGRSDAKIYEKAVTVVGIVDKDGNVTY